VLQEGELFGGGLFEKNNMKLPAQRAGLPGNVLPFLYCAPCPHLSRWGGTGHAPVNEGIPTDLKKDCTATIPLGPHIPSGHHIDCTEVPHLV